MNDHAPRPATLLLLLVALAVAAGSAGSDETTKPYGFRGFEIYKLDLKTGPMTACDADGDGLADLLVVNNTRARIEVMLRRKDPVPPKVKKGEKLPNDLVDDQFFERKEILTEKEVWTLTAADLNQDGKVDVAYAGKPKELVVAYGDGKGQFPRTKSLPMDEAKEYRRGLAAGDLNGDGRNDLVFLATDHTAIYYQSDKGILQEPAKVPHAVKGVQAVLIEDLDGDGRKDLIHLVPASPRSVLVRFQGEDGSLGAELAFETSPWRELQIADVDPAPGAEVLVIQRVSGMLRALQLTSEEAGAAGKVPLGTMESHAFERSSGKGTRAMDLGDLNGDGKTDVVVTEPGTAQVGIYLQDAKGRLGARRTFPSLSASDRLRVADLTGDGRAEVVVLSGEERAVGIAALTADGRLPFPTTLPLEGTPKSLDTGDLNGDGRTDLVVVLEKDKRRSAQIFLQNEQGGLPDTPREVELVGLKQAPDDVLIADFDQDGPADLVLFDRFGPLRVWRATAEGNYADVAGEGKQSRSGMLTKLSRGNVALANLSGDDKRELLVASKNFARAIRLDPARGPTILDQANGRSPRSQIRGVAALDLDGDGKLEVALFDKDENMISILKRGQTGVFEIIANLEVGTLDYQALFARDLNGDGKTDLVLFGKNRFGILYNGGRTRELSGMHTIESTQRDARLGRFAVGDLNGDQGPDLAVIDSGNRGLQIFSYQAEKGFAEQIAWRAYEKKIHQERGRGPAGLREITIADLDGDGANDIAILIHDRLIVYPQ